MAVLMKIRLVPFLEWTQVKGQSNRSDIVARYSKNEKEAENVYFERPGTKEWSPSVMLGTDASSRDATIQSCLENYKQNQDDCHDKNEELFHSGSDVIYNNKQSFLKSSCQPDCSDVDKGENVFHTGEIDCIMGHVSSESLYSAEDGDPGQCTVNGQSNFTCLDFETEPLLNFSTFPEDSKLESDRGVICAKTRTVSDILLAESIRHCDGSTLVISDKIDDRDVAVREHSTNLTVDTGYLGTLDQDTVTQTDNRTESVKNLQRNNSSSDVCCEIGGKSWFESCSGCKHKHPVVCTITASGEGREATDGECSKSDCTQVGPYPRAQDTNNRSSSNAAEPNDGNVKFVNTLKGVVKYTPSLTWEVQILDTAQCQPVLSIIDSDGQTISNDIDTADEELDETVTTDAIDVVTLRSVIEQREQSYFDVHNSVANVSVSTAAIAGAMLPNSNTHNESARESNVCSTYDSGVTVNYNKLTDEAEDDSAVGQNPSLAYASGISKNKYTERADVKGAITDNNPDLKSPKRPYLFSPGGSALEHKSLLPEICALQTGHEPTSKTDVVDNAVKWEIYKAEGSHTSITFSSTSANISNSKNGNSPIYDQEEPRIASFFSFDDQLPSGVESEGMPHVGETVDSQNSCYGIRRPRAASVSSSNTNTKLSIGKTESLLQLQELRGKTKLSLETTIPVQTHSEGSRDPSSPISSDAPISASAGQIESYAAVLRANIKVDHCNGAGKSGCPTSQTNVTTGRVTAANLPEKKKKEKNKIIRGLGDSMGNQNSSGLPGERSRTPVLGRRKGSTQGLFRAAGSSMTRSVPVTPAGTPASIRSEKVGFFRKFRRNKNRPRSDSMASINSISSCASTASQGYPGRCYEDTVSRDSQSSLATNDGVVGDGPTMAGTAPPSRTTQPSSVNVPAQPHTFKQQATILQPISERPNETYPAHTHNLHSDLSLKKERHLAEKIPDHISDNSVAHRSLSPLKRQDGTTGSNLTLTDDGSEYLTASETDLTKAGTGKTSESIQGFNCDNYKVTCGTNSQNVVSEKPMKTSDVGRGNSDGLTKLSVGSNVDKARSSTQIESLHGKSAGSLLPDQESYLGTNTLPAPTKSKKFSKKLSSSKAKLDKSKTYAAVLGTGLFIANLSDTVSKDSIALRTQGIPDASCVPPKHEIFPESADDLSANFPSQAAAPVSQVESSEVGHQQGNVNTSNANFLTRSFADVVNSSSSNKRVVQPPRGPFGSLTRKDSSSGVSDTISETDEMPLAPGLHGKLPIAISKHGMKSGYKPVSEPIVWPQNITLPSQAAPSPNTVNYKNIRPRTFATVAGGHQGGGAKSQIGVKTVPSPATTPDGPRGMICHSVPRSTLSSAGSAPALGVCGARLRAAKAHSVQQLNASKSPPVSPTKPPANSPFTGTYSSPPQQAKSMPQLAGKLTISKDDSGIAVSKVSSEESVKGIKPERSSLPRPSTRNKTVTIPKLSTQITKSKTAITSTNDCKPKDTPPTHGKDSKSQTNLVLRGPADEISVIKDESLDIKENVNSEMSVSVAQECVSESSGSLHRLNTRVQQNVGTKSDKLANVYRVPVTQISQKEKMTTVKNSPEGKTEMFSKVPVLTQKVSPPGQAISLKAEATTTSRDAEGKNLGSNTVQQNKVPDIDETTVNVLSKLPISSPTCNKLQLVAKDTKSSQSAFNQHQTKQLVVTSHDTANETTNTGTNNLQAKYSEGEIIKTGSKRSISSCEVEIASGPASRDQIKTTVSTENVGVPHVTGAEREPKSGDVLTRIHHGLVEKIPVEEKRKTCAISTVNDDSKQENKSETALEEDSKSSPSLGIEGAAANIAQSRPSPRLKSDLIKDEKQQSKESSGASRELQSAQEVPSVPKDCEPISKITETSKHEKLTIEPSGNLEQKYTSVRIEKVPTENVVFTTKFNRDSEHLASNDSSISDDQLKPTDAKRDDISKEMGLGESKYVEDGSKKVAASKLSHTQHRQTSLKHTKSKTDGKIIGVSDKSRSNEKIGSIGPDNATVKNSQLPTNAESECETKVSTTHKQEQSKSPQPPPRAHRITNSSESQQHARQQTVHTNKVKSAALSSPSHPAASAITAVKKDAGTNLRGGQSAVEVPRSNETVERNGSDQLADKSTSAEVQNTPSTVADERNAAVSVSVEFSRNRPRLSSENNTATEGSSGQEGTQVKINTDSNGMDDKNRVDSNEKSDSGAAGDASDQCKVDIDIKPDQPSQTSRVTQDAAINSKQENKQSEPGYKHAVNIVDGKDAQVCGIDSNQENQSITTDNDSRKTITRETDRTSGYKPKIFDEMVSVKDVNVPSESSSAWGASLEMNEKIQSDIECLKNSATTVERSISQTDLAEKSATLEDAEKHTEVNKEEKSVQKVKISIDQTDSLSVTKEVSLCDRTEPKIITEEEVTFTIDIPAECARAGRPLPEVNEYVSATCVAVTSTSGTINTTSQLGGNETCTSVSDDGQTLMSVSGGSDLPLASASTSNGALPRHRKYKTPVNICIDRVPSAAEVVEGSSEVEHTGQQETEKFDPAASKVDEAVTGVTRKDMNTEQVDAPPGFFASNEAVKVLNNKGQFSCERLGSQAKEAEMSADNVKSSCTLPAINEPGSTCEQSAQHMEGISYNDNANVQFGRRNEHNASLSGGKHSDKLSPNESLENSGTIERRVGATAEPISASKPTESEQTHSTAIASREGGGCDPGNVQLAVEEIRVSSSASCTASKNTTPRIAITTEIANKDPVVDCVPAESNVNSSDNANITDYLKVDDRLGLKGAESDSSSIGRLIHSSEGEHSDVNFDDIVMRNMEECRIGVNKDTSESSESGSDSESDEVSSARESESEEDNNRVGNRRKGTHTVNDSDSSDDSCNKLKFKKIENVEETSSDDESSDSEEEEPKKCITDDEDHIKDREELKSKSPEDCYASKLDNMGHKVGEAYFVTRRRKRAKMVDRETITMSTQEVQCPEVCHVSTDTFDSILISSSGSSDTSPSRVQWEDDSVDELDAGQYDYYSDEEDGEWYYDDSDDSVYSDDEDSQLGATATGPVKVIYSRPRPDSPRQPRRDGFRF